MALRKTSIQIDDETLSKLQALYPNHNPSQLIRLSLAYVLERRPVIRKAGFEKGEEMDRSKDKDKETREEREKRMRRSKVILKPTTRKGAV